MSRANIPFRFPLEAFADLYGGQFRDIPMLKGIGKGGRRNLQPCDLCGERFVEDIQMWRAGWLRNDEGCDRNGFRCEDGFFRDYGRCWRCWDKCDDEVKEHIFLDKLRGLCQTMRSTEPQPALLQSLLCSPATIGAVIGYCMDFGWRPWRGVTFYYPRVFLLDKTIWGCGLIRHKWIDQARIVPHDSVGIPEIYRRQSLAKKYLATHINHKSLQRRNYFE